MRQPHPHPRIAESLKLPFDLSPAHGILHLHEHYTTGIIAKSIAKSSSGKQKKQEAAMHMDRFSKSFAEEDWPTIARAIFAPTPVEVASHVAIAWLVCVA